MQTNQSFKAQEWTQDIWSETTDVWTLNHDFEPEFP